VADLFATNMAITRLQAAVANAASGFGGTAGTEYETGSNFGVVPSGAPGSKGADYAYAVANLSAAWQTFWSAAVGSIEALDNGVTA
jgi:hypothetical protein